MNQDDLRKLFSYSGGGIAEALLRFFLRGGAQVYKAIICLRNFLYTKGVFKIHKADAVVISVGNITAGGTGKTPLVIWLCNFLKEKNVRCAILTRGYKATGNDDEPRVLEQSCPTVKVIINADRVAAAKLAASQFGAKVLVMDDGFQHRRLGRDIDIVTIDATEPFGYGRILPAGLLREPVEGLTRADTIVMTRCDQVADAELAAIEKKLLAVNGNLKIIKSVHKAAYIESSGREKTDISRVEGKRVFAFCGIGNPGAFFATLEKLRAQLVGTKIYSDHYHYKTADIEEIYRLATEKTAEMILTTQKDWGKTTNSLKPPKNMLFGYLAVELKITEGENKLTELIEKALAGRICES